MFSNPQMSFSLVSKCASTILDKHPASSQVFLRSSGELWHLLVTISHQLSLPNSMLVAFAVYLKAQVHSQGMLPKMTLNYSLEHVKRKLLCRKSNFTAMILKIITIPWSRKPLLSEDTASHVCRHSLTFVNNWKLVDREIKLRACQPPGDTHALL
jgi:hypothetical protein